MTIRGVFHALPPRVFGNRIRTRDDLARFVSGSHAIAASARLDLDDAGEHLAALCARLGLHTALGTQPLTIPDTSAARYIPAYRLPALAERIDAVTPGELARAISRHQAAPTGNTAAADQGRIARQFLQLKRFYRDCAAHRYDVLFVHHATERNA